MSQTAAWVLVGLAALLVAAAIPVLVQLRRTLRTAEETLRSTGGRVNETLDRLSATLDRLNRIADGLEGGAGRISSVLEALAGIGGALATVRSSVHAVASIGSAVAAAILGAFGVTSRRDDPDADRAESRVDPKEEKAV